MPKKKASNTANPEPSPRTEIVRYAAMTTGPFYNTTSTSGHTTQRKAMKEAADLQLDELYSIIVATVTVTIEADQAPAIKVDLTEYDGDESERIIDGETPS